MALLMTPILGGTAFLAGRMVLCIASNLTTNELILRRRFDYLKAADGSFYNPFDRGPAANCAQFFAAKRPDWYAVYSERKDLDPEVSVSKWSVSWMLRRVDVARRALVEARQRRQAEKEEWILRNYGGGKQSGGASGDVEKQ